MVQVFLLGLYLASAGLGYFYGPAYQPASWPAYIAPLAIGGLAFGHGVLLAPLGFRFSLDQVQNLNFKPASLSELGFRFMKVEVRQLLKLAATENEAIKDFKRMLDLTGIDLIAKRIEGERDLVEYGQSYLFDLPRLPPQDQHITATQ